MNVFEYTVQHLGITSWHWTDPTNSSPKPATPTRSFSAKKLFDPLQPLRQWVDSLEIKHSKMAHQICKMIPAQCPFERDVKIFGRVWFHIPPMCKLNPLYEEVVGLRFRALCYLADECGEDISAYC
jgi:hypothetical protein